MKQGGKMKQLNLTNPMNPLPYEVLPEPQETFTMPERIDYKAKTMPYYVYTFIDRDGRQRERVFPQSPYQADHKAEKFMMRFLKSIAISGLKVKLDVVERDEYHKANYKVSPYAAPIPANYPHIR